MIKKHFLIYLLFSASLFAFGVGQGDKEYQIQEHNEGKFIFPKEYRKNAYRVMDYLDEIFKEYDKSFGYKLHNNPTVILTSNHNQIANATATVVPNTISTWYGGGAANIDYFNSQNWAMTLAFHETAHTYQMDAKEGVSKTLEGTLGSNPVPLITPIIPIPIFTVPNTLLPDFILEGNAVFNESRFGVGGRMYGGRHRALFLSLLKNNKLNFSRLLNNHDDFPFLEEKYIVGGYFFSYLESQYGTDRVNSFFKKHATHWVNPLNITDTCYKVFGKSFTRLVYEFLQSYLPMAQKFTQTEGKIIAKSLAYAPFGKDKDEILFFHTDLVNSPKVSSYFEGEIETIKGDFLTGKPFRIDGEIVTRASSIVEKSKMADRKSVV